MATIKRRRIEIIAFERERVVERVAASHCPLCLSESKWLTTAQAASLAQVNAATVRRWLTEGRAHGVRTASGRHRVCRNSLFQPAFRGGMPQ